jgi:hypothetical protein
MSEVPVTTQDATAAFLTDALRSTGTIGSSTSVAEVEHERIGVGVGIVGQLARLNLRYEGDAKGAPGSVVVKIPSEYPENRAVGDHFRFYEREGRFYREISDKLPVRTPRCYWNHIDVERNEFGLLLEDLGNRIALSQIVGADPERAAEALASLAGLHAAWWQSPALDGLDWMPWLNDPVNLAAGEQYRMAWPAFVDLVSSRLPDGALRIGERAQLAFEELMQIGVAEAPSTICHGDFRLDNLLYHDGAEDADRLAILDWQITYRGPAVNDVAYFLCQSLAVDVRRQCEQALVRGWYDRVARDLGVSEIADYPYEQVWHDYRRAVLGTTVYPVTAAGSMDPANERGFELVVAMADRAFSAALDLESEELVP